MNIVITGASAGIGYQVALLLSADSENKVVAVSRNREKLEKLKAESLSQNSGSKIITIAGDITNEQFVKSAVDEIKSGMGHINVLINNAGLLINKPFEELTLKDWSDVYSTNVFGTVNMVRGLLPLLSQAVKINVAEKAHVVNISSMGGFQGSMKYKGLSAYSSSKAAISGLTECLAEEFKEMNIAVNCLCLGSVNTEMFAAAFPSFKASTSPQEMSKFIVQFAIEGQKFFNGKIIPVSDSTP